MTIIESLCNYFAEAPCLEHDERIGINFLGTGGIEYAVFLLPGQETVKQYVDGTRIVAQLFTFASVQYYGADIIASLESNGFFEELSDWIYTQNKNRKLPKLPNGKTATKIEAVSPGYAYDEDASKAKYQIQCRLEYMI